MVENKFNKSLNSHALSCPHFKTIFCAFRIYCYDIYVESNQTVHIFCSFSFTTRSSFVHALNEAWAWRLCDADKLQC